MHRTKLFLSLALLGFSTSVRAQSDTATVSCENEWARTVCAVENQLADAVRQNDATAISRIYADDFILINYRGITLDKRTVLRALQSNALHFDSLIVNERRPRVYGTTAVITGSYHQRSNVRGTAEPSDVRFTHVYVFRGGKWQLEVAQITAMIP